MKVTDFKYLTDKLRIDHTQLKKPWLRAKIFHLICTPSRCINLIQGILDERKQYFEYGADSIRRPIFLWEPVPDACGLDDLPQLIKALEYVDVVSPNHHELASLFAENLEGGDVEREMDQMKRQSEYLFNKGFNTKSGAVVVRCGERGCYLKTKRKSFMLPAYHQRSPSEGLSPSKVVDPTGAGNAFLGGFAAGMLERFGLSQGLFTGAIYGTIAASFAVEQVGLPKLEVIEGQEFWNRDQVQRRLQEFKSRIEKAETGFESP